MFALVVFFFTQNKNIITVEPKKHQ